MAGRHRGNRSARRYWAERFAVAKRAEMALGRLRRREAGLRASERMFEAERLPREPSSGTGVPRLD